MHKRKYKSGLILLLIALPLCWWACDKPNPPSGCTDITASNYENWAIIDDSSCVYPEAGALIFQDEFNGSSLDNSKWVHDIGTGEWGWGNGELQYYRPENTIVSNGTAKITAEIGTNGLDYTSSKIKTDGKFTFRYGKVQARIKTVEGQGFWPAFWMLPSGGSWPCDGEIDIMEHWGNNGSTNETTGAAHLGLCPYSSSSHAYKSFHQEISSGSYADDFHVYEVRWMPNHITWYVDNIKVFEVTPDMYPSSYEWPFNSNQWYLILNLAITSSGPNSYTEFPSQIEIDWVRVYNYG